MTIDEFSLTEENLKLFNNIRNSIIKISNEIGIRYGEVFDVDYRYINVEIDDFGVLIIYCEFDSYNTYDDIEVENLYIPFEDLLLDQETCLAKLIQKRNTDEEEEKIDHLKRYIQNLKDNIEEIENELNK